MKEHFAIFLMLGLINLVPAKPAHLSVPLTYATPLTSGTRVDTSRGETPDRQEDSILHLNERRTNSVNEVGKSIEPRERESSRLTVNDGAPLGVDGRVVDTPEVAAAKAAHAAAHVNEKIKLAKEAARSGSVLDPSKTSDEPAILTGETVIGPDDGVLNAPRVNEKINLEAGDALVRLVDGSAIPLILDGNGVVAALVPIGLDGKSLNVPKTVVTHGNQNPVTDVRSVDALAIAGPALAYGRLIY